MARPVRCDYCGRESTPQDAESEDWLSVLDGGAWDFCSLEHLSLWSEEQLAKT